MKKIELWANSVQGLIVQVPSGVLYMNQTGGTYCGHPELEGVYVPLPQHCDVEGALLDEWFFDGGNVNYSRSAYYSRLEEIAKLLEHAGLSSVLESIPASRWELAKELWKTGWGEAWIPVQVKEVKRIPGQEYTEMVASLSGHFAILTYQNSD